MKNVKKWICCVLSFIMVFACSVGNVQAKAETVFNTCKNAKLTLSISASSEDTKFSFSCTDGCKLEYSYCGMSSVSIGAYKRISKSYDLVFNQSGTHSVKVYEDGEYLQNVTVNVSENHNVTSWNITKSPTIFANGEKEGKCSVCGEKVKEKIQKKTANVQLSKNSITVKKGSQTQITIKKKSKGDKVSTWKSSNKNIVAVNAKTGVIKAKKKGTAYVTVKMKSGCTAKIKVKVK